MHIMLRMEVEVGRHVGSQKKRAPWTELAREKVLAKYSPSCREVKYAPSRRVSPR